MQHYDYVTAYLVVVVVEQPQALDQFDQADGEGEGCGEGLYRGPPFIGEGVHDIQQQVDHLKTPGQGKYTHNHTQTQRLIENPTPQTNSPS